MDEKPSQVSELLALLAAGRERQEETLKPENLRYVLYARKSTVDEGRQEKSIPDQINDCLERVVMPNNITLGNEDIIEEKGSAKEPDIRTKFRAMLDALIAGKYDGIIAWHPDRLARNMKEAGEIIDLLDKGIIKDLRFATSTFENSPTGKMLLGISFVLSKQYSEHLSETVTRGNRRRTEAGYALAKMKHGYYISDGKIFPDGENFNIVRSAFNMRLKGKPQAEIVRYLNKRSDYRVYYLYATGGARKPYKWDKDAVSSMLRDTFYVGILRYGNAYSVLNDFYDFTPMISEKEYLQINPKADLVNMRFKAQAVRTNISAKLLNGRIICADCGQTLSAGITTKKGGQELILRYRCETVQCPMFNKGPRAKVITDYCINFLDEHRFTTQSNYEKYRQDMAQYQVKLNAELTKLITSLAKQEVQKEQEYHNALNIAADKTHRLAERYTEYVDVLDGELKAIGKDLAKAKKQKAELKSVILSYEKYLELFGNVADLLRQNMSLEQLNLTLSKFYSNLTVKGELLPPKNHITRWEVVGHKLNEPYAGFVKSHNFELGRQTDTAVEPILLQMYEALLNYQDFKERLAGLRSLVGTLTPSSSVADKSFLV